MSVIYISQRNSSTTDLSLIFIELRTMCIQPIATRMKFYGLCDVIDHVELTKLSHTTVENFINFIALNHSVL